MNPGGGSQRTGRGGHSEPGGGVTVNHHEHINNEHINNELIDRIDSDEIAKIGKVVYEKFKDQVTKEEYKEIMERVIAANPNKNIMKYIQTAFDRHVQAKKAMSASKHSNKRRYQSKSSKPKIEMVKPDEQAGPDLTDEELEEIKAIAAKLDAQ